MASEGYYYTDFATANTDYNNSHSTTNSLHSDTSGIVQQYTINGNVITKWITLNTYPTGSYVGDIYNAGDVLPVAGGPYSFYLYPAPAQSVCLLSDCDVMMCDGSYKNIKDITQSDEVMGCFSKKSCKIVEVIKNTHKLSDLEKTNVPYLIRKLAVGVDTPGKDIHISGHHRVIMSQLDGKYLGVQTFKLDFPEVVDIKDEQVDYYHIKLEDKQEGLVVNNLFVESFQE